MWVSFKDRLLRVHDQISGRRRDKKVKVREPCKKVKIRREVVNLIKRKKEARVRFWKMKLDRVFEEY